MSGTWILRRLALTALLAMAGAAVLLAVLVFIVPLPGAPFAIALVLALPLAALAGWQVVDALRTGELPYRFGVDRRDAQPVAYWAGLAVMAASTLGLILLAGWCAAMLIRG
jgi:hypothetical protein